MSNKVIYMNSQAFYPSSIDREMTKIGDVRTMLSGKTRFYYRANKSKWTITWLGLHESLIPAIRSIYRLSTPFTYTDEYGNERTVLCLPGGYSTALSAENISLSGIIYYDVTLVVDEITADLIETEYNPAGTGDLVMIIHSHGVDYDGVWYYSQLYGAWSRRNTGLPTGYLWQFIRVHPTDTSTWVICGITTTSSSSLGGWSTVNDDGAGNLHVLTGGDILSPAWYTTDAGLTWYELELTVPHRLAQDADYQDFAYARIFDMFFDRTITDRIYLVGSVDDTYTNHVGRYAEPIIWQGDPTGGILGGFIDVTPRSVARNGHNASVPSLDGGIVGNIDDYQGYYYWGKEGTTTANIWTLLTGAGTEYTTTFFSKIAEYDPQTTVASGARTLFYNYITNTTPNGGIVYGTADYQTSSVTTLFTPETRTSTLFGGVPNYAGSIAMTWAYDALYIAGGMGIHIYLAPFASSTHTTAYPSLYFSSINRDEQTKRIVAAIDHWNSTFYMGNKDGWSTVPFPTGLSANTGTGSAAYWIPTSAFDVIG